MNSPEIINFISSRQFKSISYIEKLSSLSPAKEYQYDYSINLQTKAKLSSVVNIFVSAEDLKKYFIDPLKILHKKVNLKRIINVETQFRSYIPPGLFYHSALEKLLPDGYIRDCIKVNGCVEYVSIKYTLEDKFITIESEISYKTFLFKHKPKNIQPKTISLSLDEVDELVLLLETTLA